MRPLVSGLALGMLCLGAPAAAETNALKALEREIAEIVEGASGFVVSICAETRSEQDGGLHRKIGSGVVLDSTGYVLTTADVVEHAQRISIRTADGRDLAARLLATDRESKLALVGTAPQQTRCPTLADSDRLKVGQWAIILGNSMGVAPTVAIGLISGYQEDSRLIQLTSFAFPGNSGAPVFDSDGRVIGIVTAAIVQPADDPTSRRPGGSQSLSPFGSAGSSAIMLAVPANRARQIAARLFAQAAEQDRRYGWLGVTGEEFSIESRRGVRVVQVVPGSPAERASIRPNDIILEYDGRRTETIGQLVSLVKNTAVDRRVGISLRRDGQQIRTWITVGRCPRELLAQQRP